MVVDWMVHLQTAILWMLTKHLPLQIVAVWVTSCVWKVSKRKCSQLLKSTVGRNDSSRLYCWINFNLFRHSIHLFSFWPFRSLNEQSRLTNLLLPVVLLLLWWAVLPLLYCQWCRRCLTKEFTPLFYFNALLCLLVLLSCWDHDNKMNDTP